MNNIHPRHQTSPSYSRTCPVVLSHPSTRESIAGLAIIDDQAGMTFVDPMIQKALKLTPESMEATMQGTITIEGESLAKPCHIVRGLVVSPLDGNRKIDLPPCDYAKQDSGCLGPSSFPKRSREHSRIQRIRQVFSREEKPLAYDSLDWERLYASSIPKTSL